MCTLTNEWKELGSIEKIKTVETVILAIIALATAAKYVVKFIGYVFALRKKTAEK